MRLDDYQREALSAAYRRGAEEMRERCAEAAEAYRGPEWTVGTIGEGMYRHLVGPVITKKQLIATTIRALPIDEGEKGGEEG